MSRNAPIAKPSPLGPGASTTPLARPTASSTPVPPGPSPPQATTKLVAPQPVHVSPLVTNSQPATEGSHLPTGLAPHTDPDTATPAVPLNAQPSTTSQHDPAHIAYLNSLPVPSAPASAPKIDFTQPGILQDRPVYEVDIQNLVEKNWRKPGSDLSDWFNYGFDEISWEAYCVRRKELGETASILKDAVLVSVMSASMWHTTNKNTCLIRISPVCRKTRYPPFLWSCARR